MIIRARIVTVGEHIRVRIVDQADLKLLPVDSDGEVRVRIVTTGEDFCAEIIRVAKALTLITFIKDELNCIRVFRPFE